MQQGLIANCTLLDRRLYPVQWPGQRQLEKQFLVAKLKRWFAVICIPLMLKAGHKPNTHDHHLRHAR